LTDAAFRRRRRQSRLAADGLLLSTAFLWGVTFVAQKYATATMPALAFVAARFAVSAAALAPFALWEFRRKPHAPSRDEWRLALAIGLTLFLGTSLQQAGIETTSATNAGFLTACYVVLTPFVVWALTGGRPRAIVVAAGFVSLVAGLAALCSTVFESTPPGALAGTAPTILFAGVVSGALAYTMQIFAQAHTPPAEAALILALESVFAALAGELLLGERLTVIGALGCVLILVGAVAVEFAPLLGRKAASGAA
jgi:drug/metabolite transporter (DMT)-like permease